MVVCLCFLGVDGFCDCRLPAFCFHHLPAPKGTDIFGNEAGNRRYGLWLTGWWVVVALITSADERNAEMKFLTAAYSEEVFGGRTVRRERPSCCGRAIDLFATKVTFREIAVGKKAFHLLEPACPICGRRVQAVYHLMS